MGSKSRRKGAQGERELADLWKKAGHPNAKRGLGQARAQHKIPDIDGVPDWWIEGKRYKGPPPLIRALRQAQADNAKADPRDQRPYSVSCGRSNNGPWLACLPLETLLAVLTELKEARANAAEAWDTANRLGA